VGLLAGGACASRRGSASCGARAFTVLAPSSRIGGRGARQAASTDFAQPGKCATAAAIDASTEFGFSENRLTTPPHRDVLVMFRPTRGALRDRHERWVRDAMDAAARETNALVRTEKSCGPGAPTLVLSFVDDDPQNDGGKRARSPGRARRKPLKPSRGESRLIPSEPVVTTLVCFFNFAREAAGAAGTRLSLRPPFSRVLSSHNSDATRREKADAYPLGCLTFENDTRPRIPGGDAANQAGRQRLFRRVSSGRTGCAQYPQVEQRGATGT
jgi:hypothetical protein